MDMQKTDSGILLPNHSVDKVRLMIDRYTRGVAGMTEWAKIAKRAVEMTENQQWEADVLAQLQKQGRAAFTWNEIRVLVRLVLGYIASTKTDIKILPAFQGYATQDVADVLTALIKQLSEACQQSWVDGEVVKDGLITGRGYYDTRLEFDDNELGEISVTSTDPFSVILDPDGDQYDLNTLGWVMEDRWASIDEIEFTYGPEAAAVVQPLVNSTHNLPAAFSSSMGIITPWRGFGGALSNGFTESFDSYISNAYDYARKNLRIVDCQHYVKCNRRYWLDMETGTKHPVPDNWTPEQIAKVQQYVQAKYQDRGLACPVQLVVRPGKRVRWTTLVGDIVVYDNWSMYRSFTKTAYFPWFRRGKTQGMVEDLIQPQEAFNKIASTNAEIVSRSSFGGWQAEETSLTPEEKERLLNEGSSPGYVQFYKDGRKKPEQIIPAQPSQALERLQIFNSEELKKISGINESALGQLDRVQSGVAVQARQRQTVVAIQIYLDNISRTKELQGRKELEDIQDWYSEERIYRMTGDDGKTMDMTINKRLASGEIVNNVTCGNYEFAVDETPLSKTFAEGQQEEIKSLIASGILNPASAKVKEKVLQMSSIPNKEQFIKDLAEEEAAQAEAMGKADKKLPEESLMYKDAPEDIRRQLEQRAGLQPSTIGAVPQVPVAPGVPQPSQPMPDQPQLPQ